MLQKQCKGISFFPQEVSNTKHLLFFLPGSVCHDFLFINNLSICMIKSQDFNHTLTCYYQDVKALNFNPGYWNLPQWHKERESCIKYELSFYHFITQNEHNVFTSSGAKNVWLLKLSLGSRNSPLIGVSWPSIILFSSKLLHNREDTSAVRTKASSSSQEGYDRKEMLVWCFTDEFMKVVPQKSPLCDAATN